MRVGVGDGRILSVILISCWCGSMLILDYIVVGLAVSGSVVIIIIRIVSAVIVAGLSWYRCWLLL